MRALLITLALALSYSSTATAQGLPPQGARFQSPVIGGLPVNCGGAVTIIDYTLNDSAHALILPQGAVIILNPRVIAGLPGPTQLYIYGHECGHLFLRTADESRADCWSVQTGEQQGWFVRDDLVNIAQIFANNPGDFTHPPGPMRVAHMLDCFDHALAAGTPSNGFPV